MPPLPRGCAGLSSGPAMKPSSDADKAVKIFVMPSPSLRRNYAVRRAPPCELTGAPGAGPLGLLAQRDRGLGGQRAAGESITVSSKGMEKDLQPDFGSRSRRYEASISGAASDVWRSLNVSSASARL